MTLRRAFTFVEVAVVLIILGILAAMVVPRFGGITDDARTASVQGTVNGVRASIAAYRTNALLAGNPPFPALKELLYPGLVLQSDIPPNPFTGVGGVREVSSKAGMYRLVDGEEKYGWNYYVDNSATPPVAIFYANSSAETTAKNADGKPLTANEL